MDPEWLRLEFCSSLAVAKYGEVISVNVMIDEGNDSTLKRIDLSIEDVRPNPRCSIPRSNYNAILSIE